MHRTGLLRGKSIKQRQAQAGIIFIAPAVIYFSVTFIGTVFYNIYLTFVKFSLSGENRFIGFSQYEAALTDTTFWLSLKNTFYFTVLSIPAIVILALAAALLFSSTVDFKFKGFFKAIYFLPVITSSVAVAFVWDWLYQPEIGLFNYILKSCGLPRQLWLHSAKQVIPSISLMHVWSRLGFNMVIFIAGLEAIPKQLYEAAEIDGAKGWKTFFHITLPLLNPQLLLVGILEVITALRMFSLPYVATGGGPGNASRMVVLHIHDKAFKWMKMGEASVAALILFIIIIFISVLQWRFLRKPVEY